MRENVDGAVSGGINPGLVRENAYALPTQQRETIRFQHVNSGLH